MSGTLEKIAQIDGAGMTVAFSRLTELEQVARKLKQDGAATQAAAATSEAIIEEVLAYEEATATITGTTGAADSHRSTIAAAVEQQGAGAKKISSNMQRAAQRTAAVSANMAEPWRAVAHANASADHLLTASTIAGGKTRTLNEEIKRFLRNVAAA